MTGVLKKLFPVLQTKEERAENEAYQKECLKLAVVKGTARAKSKYKS